MVFQDPAAAFFPRMWVWDAVTEPLRNFSSCSREELWEKARKLLGRIENLEGRILQTIHTRWDGRVLYHTVSLGVTAGDALVAYGKMG